MKDAPAPPASYNHRMARRTLHISEADAARDFAALLAHVRAGADVVIEQGDLPVAILRPAMPPIRLLSESLQAARQHPPTATLDPDFGRHLNDAIASHREGITPPAWD